MKDESLVSAALQICGFLQVFIRRLSERCVTKVAMKS
jgi:hypothetical protein